MFHRSGSCLTSFRSSRTLLKFLTACFCLSETALNETPKDFCTGIKSRHRSMMRALQTTNKFSAVVTFMSQGTANETAMAPKAPPAAIKGNSALALRESTRSFARVQNMRKRSIFVTYAYENRKGYKSGRCRSKAYFISRSMHPWPNVKIMKKRPLSTLSMSDMRADEDMNRKTALTRNMPGMDRISQCASRRDSAVLSPRMALAKQQKRMAKSGHLYFFSASTRWKCFNHCMNDRLSTYSTIRTWSKIVLLWLSSRQVLLSNTMY